MSSNPNSRNVAQPIPAMMYGVVKLQMKLNSHCDPTPNATPGSRIRVGKISVFLLFSIDSYVRGMKMRELYRRKLAKAGAPS